VNVQDETGGKVLRVVIVGGVGWVVIMEGWSVKYDSAACLNLTLLLDVETKGFRQGLEELVEGIDKGFRGRKEIY